MNDLSVATSRPNGPTDTLPAEGLPERMFAEAVARQRAGQGAQAEALYRAVLALHPGYAQASYNLGLLQQGARRLEEAVLSYRHAIAVHPSYFDAYCNLGVALQDLGRPEEALGVYRAVIAMKPDFAMAHCNLGVTLRGLRRLEEAVFAYQQAITIQPDYQWAYTNLAAVLMDLGDAPAAIAACERAVAIQPDMETAYFNLGSAYKALCRLPEAAAAFRQAIALREGFVEAHFTLGQTLLLQGDLSAGWAEYEWRWKLVDYAWLYQAYGAFTQPYWAGEPLAGQTILVYAEQGLGDAIQFVRYIPLLQAQGATVVLAVHPPLRQLFAQLADVTVIDLGNPALPSFDVHCPLLSLPRLFGTVLETIPANVPYLRAPQSARVAWRNRLSRDRLRVGVVWAGNPTQTGDRLRSPRLAAVLPLFDVPDIMFVTLQLGPGRDDLRAYRLPAHVHDFGAEITDFTDTAAIMQELDLVISSCTAPLHLAGALGVPVWAMLPFSPHFPWLLDRVDSLWYPTATLYRQARAGTDWSGVISDIAGDLAKLRRAKCGF
jgi:tetratricopeptide (TPR) repeat protein